LAGSNSGPLRGGEARGEPRRGGVTSRAGKRELRRAVSNVTRGEGGIAARPVDEGVCVGKGDQRRDWWTRGFARGRGSAERKRCEGVRRIALRVGKG